ncbi:MAG: ATP-binding protein [Planctomycetes bacterium]|nr:ATP-binding protein [Planctomycetota bacterium]
MDFQVPDLSGKLRVTLEKALEEGKQLKLQGKAVDAAAKYEAAHKIALQLKDYAKTREEEHEYLGRAVKYRRHAEALREGRAKVGPEALKPPSPPAAEGRPAGGKKKAKEREEVAELKQTVQGLIQTAKVGWDDIGGLDEVKQEIKFALGIWLAQAPEAGGKKVQLQSWRNMLFYGPPGTGKTLLAGAASRALKTREDKGAVFFNVKVSSVLSKYFGESSKIVSELYGTARDLSPSVIFLDEFESLAANRDSAGDTGAERRILSTILAELDGLAEKGRTDIYVLTIAATNRPWDLDDAALSRFDKKVLIPLPDPVTRKAIFEIQVGKRGLQTQVSYDDLVAMTEGCSGREIERFCKEAQTRMVREMNTGIPALVDRGIDAIRGHTVKIRPLAREDFGSPPKPQTTPEEMKRYLRWREENS